MSEIKVNVDGLHDAMINILKEYGDKGSDAINLAIEDEANEVRKNVRRNVSSAGIKGKRYKGGWQIKKQYSPSGLSCTIYNGSLPGLPHLLEKGHQVVVNGRNVGHANPHAHVDPATENMEKDLMDKIQKNLELLG